MTFESHEVIRERERQGTARLAAVTPVANGLIDAVRARDRYWVGDVLERVTAGEVDCQALLVCLAAKAGAR